MSIGEKLMFLFAWNAFLNGEELEMRSGWCRVIHRTDEHVDVGALQIGEVVFVLLVEEVEVVLVCGTVIKEEH